MTGNDGEGNYNSLKMKNTPVGRLLFSMALPAILSMLVQALYNVVDSVFVAQISNKALYALSLASPMQTLLISVAVGIGVGANAKIAQRLGEGKNKEASAIALNGVFLSIIAAVVFVILAFTVTKPFIGLYTSDAEALQMGSDYLMIVFAGGVGSFIEITLTKALQATGNMKIPMISQLIGAGLNIALDPLFIFTFGMGVRGAAIATVIGQVAALVFVGLVCTFGKHDLSFGLKGFRPSGKHIKEILGIGLPTTVMNAVTPFTTIFFNFIVGTIPNYDGVTIYGVYNKLQSFVFMPIFGLMQGSLPILGYNYGANDRKRFDSAFKLSLLTAAAILAVGMTVMMSLTGPLCKIFAVNDKLLPDYVYAIRIISICFIPAAFGITISTVFQSLGCGIKALVMSLLRQVVLLLPLTWLLAVLFGKDGVWFAFPIAEVIVPMIFIPLSLATRRKKFAALSAAPAVAVADGGVPSENAEADSAFDVSEAETVLSETAAHAEDRE